MLPLNFKGEEMPWGILPPFFIALKKNICLFKNKSRSEYMKNKMGFCINFQNMVMADHD